MKMFREMELEDWKIRLRGNGRKVTWNFSEGRDKAYYIN